MTSELAQQARAAIAQRGLHLDAGQAQAFTRLADWLQARLQPPGWLRRVPRGGYLHGAVGRGKSLLLDSLFAAAPLANKRRVHVHALLQEVQQRLLAHSGKAQPLTLVARELCAESQLLFFDEFHVHDIGDAILLGRLLEQLFKHDCTLLFSSNYEPAQLCPNPLYHSRFKPYAELIKRHCVVLPMEAGLDYRPLSPRHWGRYVQTSAAELAAQLSDLPRLSALPVGRRQLSIRGHSADCLWLDFAALCQQPLASSDYLQLCQRFKRIVVSDVPPLARCNLDEQQRWVNFIDIAYDAGTQLWLHSSLDFEALCAQAGHTDFSRTRSRLAQLARGVEA
ncbi:cell division protein ZapE [Pseudomonas sp. 5P_3.1_Bac2]|uniref:cell division protein ZapE n=1 Tax=Pseudomonas sp. 5P_3.1_Bac2 TaxID=2971617 RepID=UPI0021C7EA03|nr:cell division protein ZapE [Pseudomonas sp. 5P_3.1_Bac2]MCU1717962.1 cell division protein ZapE [Pseudomonas sp. 5P_3.1_Bac2]